jgi:hypothetical protein
MIAALIKIGFTEAELTELRNKLTVKNAANGIACTIVDILQWLACLTAKFAMGTIKLASIMVRLLLQETLRGVGGGIKGICAGLGWNWDGEEWDANKEFRRMGVCDNVGGCLDDDGGEYEETDDNDGENEEKPPKKGCTDCKDDPIPQEEGETPQIEQPTGQISIFSQKLYEETPSDMRPSKTVIDLPDPKPREAYTYQAINRESIDNPELYQNPKNINPGDIVILNQQFDKPCVVLGKKEDKLLIQDSDGTRTIIEISANNIYKPKEQPITLSGFKTQQIKELDKNWRAFSNQDIEDGVYLELKDLKTGSIRPAKIEKNGRHVNDGVFGIDKTQHLYYDITYLDTNEKKDRVKIEYSLVRRLPEGYITTQNQTNDGLKRTKEQLETDPIFKKYNIILADLYDHPNQNQINVNHENKYEILAVYNMEPPYDLICEIRINKAKPDSVQIRTREMKKSWSNPSQVKYAVSLIETVMIDKEIQSLVDIMIPTDLTRSDSISQNGNTYQITLSEDKDKEKISVYQLSISNEEGQYNFSSKIGETTKNFESLEELKTDYNTFINLFNETKNLDSEFNTCLEKTKNIYNKDGVTIDLHLKSLDDINKRTISILYNEEEIGTIEIMPDGKKKIFIFDEEQNISNIAEKNYQAILEVIATKITEKYYAFRDELINGITQNQIPIINVIKPSFQLYSTWDFLNRSSTLNNDLSLNVKQNETEHPDSLTVSVKFDPKTRQIVANTLIYTTLTNKKITASYSPGKSAQEIIDILNSYSKLPVTQPIQQAPQ